MKSKANWTPEVYDYTIQEDNFLKLQGNTTEKKNWVQISEKLKAQFPNKTRSAKQCRERFINHSSVVFQNSKQNFWNQKEIIKLFTVFGEVGPKWSCITLNFKGSTQNSVKNKVSGCIRKLVRKLNKLHHVQNGKQIKKLKYESVFRILNAPHSIKTLKQEFRDRALHIRLKIVQAIIYPEILQVQANSLIEQINIFNRDSRNYKQDRSKIIKHSNSILLKQNSVSQHIEILNEKCLSSNLKESNRVEQAIPSSISSQQACFEHVPCVDQHIKQISPLIQNYSQNQFNQIDKFWLNHLLDQDEIQHKICQEKRNKIKQFQFQQAEDISQNIFSKFQYY